MISSRSQSSKIPSKKQKKLINHLSINNIRKTQILKKFITKNKKRRNSDSYFQSFLSKRRTAADHAQSIKKLSINNSSVNLNKTLKIEGFHNFKNKFYESFEKNKMKKNEKKNEQKKIQFKKEEQKAVNDKEEEHKCKLNLNQGYNNDININENKYFHIIENSRCDFNDPDELLQPKLNEDMRKNLQKYEKIFTNNMKFNSRKNVLSLMEFANNISNQMPRLNYDYQSQIDKNGIGKKDVYNIPINIDYSKENYFNNNNTFIKSLTTKNKVFKNKNISDDTGKFNYVLNDFKNNDNNNIQMERNLVFNSFSNKNNLNKKTPKININNNSFNSFHEKKAKKGKINNNKNVKKVKKNKQNEFICSNENKLFIQAEYEKKIHNKNYSITRDSLTLPINSHNKYDNEGIYTNPINNSNLRNENCKTCREKHNNIPALNDNLYVQNYPHPYFNNVENKYPQNEIMNRGNLTERIKSDKINNGRNEENNNLMNSYYNRYYISSSNFDKSFNCINNHNINKFYDDFFRTNNYEDNYNNIKKVVDINLIDDKYMKQMRLFDEEEFKKIKAIATNKPKKKKKFNYVKKNFSFCKKIKNFNQYLINLNYGYAGNSSSIMPVNDI